MLFTIGSMGIIILCFSKYVKNNPMRKKLYFFFLWFIIINKSMRHYFMLKYNVILKKDSRGEQNK